MDSTAGEGSMFYAYGDPNDGSVLFVDSQEEEEESDEVVFITDSGTTTHIVKEKKRAVRFSPCG